VNDTEGLPDFRMVCGVCGVPLDIVNGEWEHGNPTLQDHPPVPVHADDLPVVNCLCDFCMGPATFTHEVADHQMLTQVSVGNFSACNTCHEAIVKQDWDTVLGRQIEGCVRVAAEAGKPYLASDMDSVTDMCNFVLAGFRENRSGRWVAGGYATLVSG
jgi:hypothetical protein